MTLPDELLANKGQRLAEGMTRYMLDANTVSHLIRGHPMVTRRMVSVPTASLSISSIAEGELMFGLGKRPEAVRPHHLVRVFLLRVDVVP